jgi:hypothetical protein
MCSNFLYMSNMDMGVGSSVRWLSASTMINDMILTPHMAQMAQILGHNCVRLPPYAYGEHMNVLKLSCMFNMDVGSSLKWL